jgi:hypothetical protein
MPVTYEYVEDILEIRASGTYPADAVTQIFAEVIADRARPRLHALLYDARASEVITSRSTVDVQRAVDFFRGLGPHIGMRMALVAGNDAVYGVMRMIAAWAEGAAITAGVFRDRDEALAWARL